MLQATLSLFTAVLSADPSQLQEKDLKTPPDEQTRERGTPALFSWGDIDGDARLELAAVSAEGVLQLLANAGEGRFEDVTERVGLSGVANAALALWVDYDSDGRLDLFVGARAGASRLFHNEGGVFVDMTAASGLVIEGAVQSAHWLDHDGDGRLDLHVVTPESSELCSIVFRGLEGGFFERSELPALSGAGVVSIPGGPIVVATGGAASSDNAPSTPRAPGTGGTAGRPIGREVSLDGTPAGGRIALVPTITTVIPLDCASTVFDQANPGTCLQASSTPTLGKLYPISSRLFVAVGGNVGIGTTTPSAKLDVAGTARITNTLTLAPAGDQALNISTGSIYKGGALFIHTKGGVNTAVGGQALANVGGYFNGAFNTALGADALRNNTFGDRNTASGAYALRSNNNGNDNTASGFEALRSNTYGYSNTACGAEALRFNVEGKFNTASGAGALRSNTYGYSNTASGASALRSNLMGSGNTACGGGALLSNTFGNSNTASGVSALRYNTTGGENTASGVAALFNNTTGGHNTASGWAALNSNTTGSDNIALGYKAGWNLTTGSNNIAIGNQGAAAESATIRLGTAGTHTRAFVAGIRGVTTGVANAIPVVVDSAGQLGTISSSRRFKEEIEDMGNRTERLLQLRPVVFRYKPEVQSGERPLEYGLIAEEVAEVFPELVVYDEEGKPFTVKYHLLSSMLLNELKEQARQIQEQAQQLEAQNERFALQDARLAALEGRVAATGARPESP